MDDDRKRAVSNASDDGEQDSRDVGGRNGGNGDNDDDGKDEESPAPSSSRRHGSNGGSGSSSSSARPLITPPSVPLFGSEMDADTREYKSAEAKEREDKRATEVAMRLHSEDPGDDEKSHKIFFLGKRNQKFRDEKGDFKGMQQTVRLIPWKMKERMRTVSVGLVLCLNIGVDPPDVGVKPVPCAKLECWIDPMSMAAPRALEEIGKGLQLQYERWQPRAKYKQCLDPTVPDVKKLCVSLRKAAKNERVLLHYNGHGVPRPTANGEVWVFNKTYTQYIPLSIYDLHSWLGSPATLLLDCTAAGLVVDAFTGFVKQKEDEAAALIAAAGPNGVAAAKAKQTVARLKDCIIMASCSGRDQLPMSPDLPADLFTTCLTDPLKIALRCFAANSNLTRFSSEITDKIPGRQSDRKTPLGELNWIFTSITDTIAWTVLPRDLFQKLFRQDLLVASLFRNFLLADRVMRSFGCTPVSYPKIPPTHKHPMWEAWDLAMEHSLLQLDKFLKHGVKFTHSPFFAEHLTAFEVWLEVGGQETSPPVQLPIVLQVLLSQAHRRRALVLLARFLGKGVWAVNLALAVGIFPYVLKLLQSPALELRDVLVFIWTKILAVDRSCQSDLVKDNYHEYFLTALTPSLPAPMDHHTRGVSGSLNNNGTSSIVSPPSSSHHPHHQHHNHHSHQHPMYNGSLPPLPPLHPTPTTPSLAPSSSSSTPPPQPLPPTHASGGPVMTPALALDRQRAMAGFVLSVLCDRHMDGQRKLLAGRAMAIFHHHMDSENALLRRWMTLCVAKLWYENDAAKMMGVHEGVSEKLCALLTDPVPEVRASSCYALGCFMGATDDDNPRRAVELAIAKSAIPLIHDGSAMVRDELVGCLAQLVFSQQDEFCILALEVEADDRAAHTSRTTSATPTSSSSSTAAAVGPAADGKIPDNHPTLRTVASTPSLVRSAAQSHISAGPPPTSPAASGLSSPPTPVHHLANNNHHPNNTAAAPPGGLHTVTSNPSLSSMADNNDNATTPPGTPAAREKRGLATIKDKDSPAGQREMIWKAMLQLCHDPFPAVASAAQSVRSYVAALNTHHVHRRHGDPRHHHHHHHGMQHAASVAGGLHRMGERGGMWADGKDSSPLHGSQHDLHAMDDSHLLRRSGSGNNMRRASSTQTLSDMTTLHHGHHGSHGGAHGPPHGPHPLPHGHPGHHRTATTNAAAYHHQYQQQYQQQQQRPPPAIDDTKVPVRRHDIGPMPSSARIQPSPLGGGPMMGGGGGPIGPGGMMGGHPMHGASSGLMSSPSLANILPDGRPQMSSSSSAPSGGQQQQHQLSPEELKMRIPESLIYNRSCDHFVVPVMDPQLDEEKNFQSAINRQWRAKRNIRMMEEAKQLKRDGYGTWSFNTAKTFTFGEPTVAGVFDQVAVLQSGFEQVSKVIFHPFENMLFASDGKHNIGVWDFKEHQQLNVFTRPESPKLTSLQLINPHDTSLLMTGADDGVVKLWRNTHLKGEQEVCAAWTAIRCPSRGGCGLVLDWQQNLGRLLAGGHSDVIRIWDAEMDTCIRDMPLQGVNTSVTALCSTTEGHVVVAGCLDGSIRMYDTRREPSLVVSTLRHTRRCVTAHLQRGGFDDGKLISGGAGGEVIMTDLRMTKEALKTLTIFDSKSGKSLDALAVHDWAPILACGSSKQVIKVVDTHGTNINTIKYYKGFMGHRIGAIKSLAFHPHQLMLAAGANNSFISLLAALPNT